MTYYANTIHKKMGVATLISGRKDFRAKKDMSNEEKHFIIIKGPVLQEEEQPFSPSAPSNRAQTREAKLTELQGQRTQHHSWKLPAPVRNGQIQQAEISEDGSGLHSLIKQPATVDTCT